MLNIFIQVSSGRTGSTVLNNIIFGFISPESKLHSYIITNVLPDKITSSLYITHNTNIDYWINKYKNYNLIFICTERNEKGFKYPIKPIDEKYKNYNNTIYFDFKELNETSDYSVEDIVNVVYNKLNYFLLNKEIDIKLNKNEGLKRLKEMNKFYLTIKNKPFSYYDKFYSIHGSHRSGRNNYS